MLQHAAPNCAKIAWAYGRLTDTPTLAVAGMNLVHHMQCMYFCRHLIRQTHLFLQDKVLELWEMTRGSLEATTATVREREVELESLVDRHAIELKVDHHRRGHR